jgi:acetoacetyl-CoA synthetase
MSDMPLWTPGPDRVASSQVTAFMAEANRRQGASLGASHGASLGTSLGTSLGSSLKDYRELHAWSVAHPDAFWNLVWDFCGIVGDKGERLVEGAGMPGTTFFPDARLNFAENLLAHPGKGDAIVFRGEDKVKKRLTWDELNALVSRLQQALKAAGVTKGDRVAAMMPNLPETLAAMLAATSLGAIWSSCSPDFGERGVLDRFGQIEPKVFIACDGYWYNGKALSLEGKLKGVVPHLPSRSTRSSSRFIRRR